MSDQVFRWIKSDKDTHFTGAITAGNKEDASLAGLLVGKVIIRSLQILSEDNCDFIVIFWSADTYDDTDLDSDTVLEIVSSPLAAVAIEVQSGVYYYSISDLYIPYSDDDDTDEIHLSLMVATGSAVNKAAGASGEVVVKIAYTEVGDVVNG